MLDVPPTVCPVCGARHSYRARYTTGGGWRVFAYRCEECGHSVPRSARVAARTARAATEHPGLAAGVLALLGAAAIALRRRFE